MKQMPIYIYYLPKIYGVFLPSVVNKCPTSENITAERLTQQRAYAEREPVAQCKQLPPSNTQPQR